MNRAVTSLYFEPWREQGTCWQPWTSPQLHTQTKEHSLEKKTKLCYGNRGARNDNLAKWMFLVEKCVFKEKEKMSTSVVSLQRRPIFPSVCPLYKSQNEARQGSQVELGKYPGQVSHLWLRRLFAAPPLRRACVRARSQGETRCRRRAKRSKRSTWSPAESASKYSSTV